MSRVGKVPVYFDKDVQVSIQGTKVTVKGKKHSQEVNLNKFIEAKVDDGKIIITRSNDEPQTRAFHGLCRALVQNAVTGVSKGFTKELELHGVGYRANVKGKKLELELGFSHTIEFDIPNNIEIKVDKQVRVAINGPNREQVGSVAAKIRGFRPPEPYLGKGVKYSDEVIRRKAGKAAGSTK